MVRLFYDLFTSNQHQYERQRFRLLLKFAKAARPLLSVLSLTVPVSSKFVFRPNWSCVLLMTALEKTER